jgi:uncharacterized small protein (DUF1192 family)
MAVLSQQYYLFPTKLHEALLTSPATAADAATHMRVTGGLTLTQAAIESGIARMIVDLGDQLVLNPADYPTLLSRHGAAAPATALEVLKASARRVLRNFLGQQLDGEIAALQAEVTALEAVKNGATTEWNSLNTAQKNAIPNIFALGSTHGIPAINALIASKQAEIADLQARRAALP